MNKMYSCMSYDKNVKRMTSMHICLHISLYGYFLIKLQLYFHTTVNQYINKSQITEASKLSWQLEQNGRFPFQKSDFQLLFQQNDTSTLKLFPISLADYRRIGYICTLEGIYNNIFIEGNTSVRLWRCGLKGIALVSIGSSIPLRHSYDECNFNILYHSCGSTIVRGFLMIIVLD